MNIDKLIEETHLGNLGDTLSDVIDVDALKTLEDTKENFERIELLSQWISGNVSETFEEIKKLTKNEIKNLIEFWASIIIDAETLRNLITTILDEL